MNLPEARQGIEFLLSLGDLPGFGSRFPARHSFPIPRDELTGRYRALQRFQIIKRPKTTRTDPADRKYFPPFLRHATTTQKCSCARVTAGSV
jgi:hypothetical protein